MEPKPKKLDSLIHLVLFITILALGSGGYFLFSDVKVLKEKIANAPTELEEISGEDENDKDECGEGCKEEIKRAVSEAVATIAASPASVSEAPQGEQEEKTVYLNLNGPLTTQSTNWIDVKSTDVYINLAEEYGEDSYLDWEAFAKTASSGSKVFVRLFDVTHGIGVAASELETNSASVTRLSSGRLYLWRGHNLYRAQVKSLNGIDATFESGRIKIVY